MPENNTQQKLLDLRSRANAIKSDPKLRHAPNEHDLLVASENARLMQMYQYQAITVKGDDT